MKNAIVHCDSPPQITMSLDSTVYFGRNQIRRNVAKCTTLYVGTSQVDRVLTVPAEGFIEVDLTIRSEGDVFDPESKTDAFFTEPTNFATKALYLDTNHPLTVYINDSIELSVAKHLFLDHPVNKIGLENLTCHEVRVTLVYIV